MNPSDQNQTNQPQASMSPAPQADSPAVISTANQFRDAAQKRKTGELITLESGNVLRVGRPSIGNLMKTGQLPSELANAAVKVQSGGNTSPDDIKKFTEYQEKLVKLAVIEPKVVESNANYDNGEINISDLSDDEQTEIMIYVNGGLEALAKFRQQRQSLSS